MFGGTLFRRGGPCSSVSSPRAFYQSASQPRLRGENFPAADAISACPVFKKLVEKTRTGARKETFLQNARRLSGALGGIGKKWITHGLPF